MSEQVEALQQQIIAARRSQILDAATTVFASKGFQRATIKDIAREAGVADGTIYNYFKNKQDVLLGILDRLNESEQRHAQLEIDTMTDVREFLVALIRHRLNAMLPHYDVLKALMSELLTNTELRDAYYKHTLAPTLTLAEAFFAAQVEAGRMRAVDVPIMVRALAGMSLGLLMIEMLGDPYMQVAWDNVPETLVTMFYDGLKPEDERNEHRG